MQNFENFQPFQICFYFIQKPSEFPGGSEVKASARNAGDLGSIPGLGRSPGEGNGNPSHGRRSLVGYGGAWWATVHGSQRVGHD